MIIKVETLTENGPHQFQVCASDAGLPVVLPTCLEPDSRIGNGQPFYLRSYDGGIAKYLQGNGCVTIKVFND